MYPNICLSDGVGSKLLPEVISAILIRYVTLTTPTLLYAPFGCTHPPPPIPPFLLKQNLSPKDIAGSDIMKLKVP